MKYRYLRAEWHGKIQAIIDLDRIFDRNERKHIDFIRQTVGDYEKAAYQRGIDIVNAEMNKNKSKDKTRKK